MKRLIFIFSFLFCIAVTTVNAENKQLVPVQDTKTGLWGLQEEGTAKWKVKPKYEAITPFIKEYGRSFGECYAKKGDKWILIYNDGEVTKYEYEDVLPYSETDKYIKIKHYSGNWIYGGIGKVQGITHSFKEAPDLTSRYTVLKGTDDKYYCVALGDDYLMSAKIEYNYGDPIANFPNFRVNLLETNDPENPYKCLDPDYLNRDPDTHVRMVKDGEKTRVIFDLTNNILAETGDIEYLREYKLSGFGYIYGKKDWKYRFENEIPDLTAISIKTYSDDDYVTVYNTKTGEIIVPQTHYKYSFAKCLAPDCFWVGGFGHATLYNVKGEILFEGNVNSDSESFGDYMKIHLNSYDRGVMNNKGEWMIEPAFGLSITPLVEEGKEEISSYAVKDQYGNLDFYSADFNKMFADLDELRCVYKDGKFAYTKADGTVVTNWYDKEDAVVAAARGGSGQDNYGSGIKRVSRNGKFGLLDTHTGKEVVPCVYDNIGSVAYGMIRVKKNGLCGFLNSSFKLVIPCKYISVGNFREVFGVAQNPFAEVVISVNGSGPYKTGYINKSGVVFQTMSTSRRDITLW